MTLSHDRHRVKRQSEKEIASREKLNLNPKANSTPNRAFFVRNIRTPKEFADFVFNLKIHSMVERNRHVLNVAANPLGAVSHPVTFYRQTVRSLAVVPEKLSKGLSKMLFKFLCVDRTHSHFNLCTQTIQANNETQARLRLSADFRHIATVARINLTLTAYFPIVSTSTQGGLANA